MTIIANGRKAAATALQQVPKRAAGMISAGKRENIAPKLDANWEW